jgi:predicted transcriptional regulator
MITSRELLSRAKIIEAIQRLPEDATIDDAIYRLEFLKAVAAGLKDTEEGRLIDDDEIWAELLNDDAQNSNHLERRGKARSAPAKGTHRKVRPKGRARVPSKTKGGDK